MNPLCSICLLLFAPADKISSTHCGHLFHFHCIHSWIEKNKTCPECRKFSNELIYIYPNIGSAFDLAESDDPSIKLEIMGKELKQKNAEIKNVSNNLAELKCEMSVLKLKLNSLIEEGIQQNETITNLKKEALQLKQARSILMVKNENLISELNDANSTESKQQNLEKEMHRPEKEPSMLRGIYMMIKAADTNINVIQFSVRDFVVDAIDKALAIPDISNRKRKKLTGMRCKIEGLYKLFLQKNNHTIIG